MLYCEKTPQIEARMTIFGNRAVKRFIDKNFVNTTCVCVCV